MYAKHFVTFMLLFFLVIIVDPNNSEKSILINFGWTILIYILYMITTRVSFPFMVILVIIMMIIYILSKIAKNKLEEKKEDEYKMLKYVQNILFIIFIILGVVGFLIYMIEKSREYKDAFSIFKFIFGTPVCRKFTPADAKLL
jgi:cytochrome b561